MVAPAELERTSEVPNQQIEAIPDTPAIPAHIEQGGVSPTPTTFTAQVAGDQGQPLIQPTANSVTITVPADEAQLTSLSKGSITSALTWLARYWIRMIKKAALFGWHVVVKPKAK